MLLDMDICQYLREINPFLQCLDAAVRLWGLWLLWRICMFVVLACLEYAEHYKQIEPPKTYHKVDPPQQDPISE